MAGDFLTRVNSDETAQSARCARSPRHMLSHQAFVFVIEHSERDWLARLLASLRTTNVTPPFGHNHLSATMLYLTIHLLPRSETWQVAYIHYIDPKHVIFCQLMGLWRVFKKLGEVTLTVLSR